MESVLQMREKTGEKTLARDGGRKNEPQHVPGTRLLK
jgi:hypothetical protein